MMDGFGIIFLGLGLGILGLFLVTMPAWVPWLLHPKSQPGKVEGLTVKFTAPRATDRGFDLLWAVSVTMQNDGHRPRVVPRMAYDTTFWSNQRTGWKRNRIWYLGHLEADFEYEVTQANGLVASRVLNPGDLVVFTAYVSMPRGQRPEVLDIASYDGTKADKHLRGSLSHENVGA